MSKDIVPELLDKLKKTFDEKVSKSGKVKWLLEKLENKKATYLDADAFAVELGELLRDTFAEVIKPEDLPNERMYYNIADRMIRDRLGANYKSISLYDEATQNLLNQQAGIHLKAVVPEMDESRVHGFVEALSEDKPFEEVKRVLEEPIVTYCRSIVQDSIEENVKFHYKSGFRPMIKRQVSGNCCPWCKEVAGTHYYPDVPDGIFRSHNHCRCTIDYRPRKGKRDKLTVQQGKKWTKAEEENKIEKRKALNRGPDFYSLPDKRVLKKEHRKYIGVNRYHDLMNRFQNGEVRKYIRTAYRKTAIIGDGSTYAIRKMEIETGLNLGRNQNNHAKKVDDLIRQISKSLSKNLPERESRYLQNELKKLKELQNADLR